MEASSTEKKRRATRADVARLAGVSTAVVSYVFNNGPRPVAADTAQQVREAAEKLHYRPNSVARALSTGSSKTLGIVVPDLTNPFFSGVYSALETAAARNGYSTLFMASHQNPEKEMDRISQLIAREVDAIIIASAQPTSALAKGVSVHLHGSDPAGSRREMRIDGFSSGGKPSGTAPAGAWVYQHRHAVRKSR